VRTGGQSIYSGKCIHLLVMDVNPTENHDKDLDMTLRMLDDLAQYPIEAFNYPKGARTGGL